MSHACASSVGSRAFVRARTLFGAGFGRVAHPAKEARSSRAARRSERSSPRVRGGEGKVSDASERIIAPRGRVVFPGGVVRDRGPSAGMSDVSGRARGPPRGGSDELSDAAPRVAKTDTVYSDRFVPSRSASAGLRGFNLLDGAAPPASASHPSSEREDTSAAYSTLLRAELLGDNNAAGLASPPRTGLGASSTPPTSAFAPASASHAPIASSRRYSHASPPSRNLFRFKTLRAAGGLGDRPDSPYSLSPVGGDGPPAGHDRHVASPRAAEDRSESVQGARRARAAG